MSALNVNLADAYAEACRQLGESMVREVLLTKEITRLTEQVAQVTEDSAAEIDRLRGTPPSSEEGI
jgi:hypothetical protein